MKPKSTDWNGAFLLQVLGVEGTKCALAVVQKIVRG